MFNWINFLTYALITAITPGPNNIMSMSKGGSVGFRKALPFNLGIWAGFTAVMLVCTAFASLLADLLPRIKLPMLILGALYMLWLAYKTYTSPPHVEEDHSGGGFLSGALLQFINPKIYIYCLVSMEAFILPYYHGQWGPLLGFCVLLSFIGFACTLLWSAFGSVFRTLFSQHAKLTNTVMALLLVYCAVSLFL